MKPVIVGAAIATAVILLFFLGLQVKPAPFSKISPENGALEKIPLPEGLPKPVERFYREIYGDHIPVINSAVISGRTIMRPFGGISFPGRFRFTHTAGQEYHHYIDITVFGLPVMKVREQYVDKRSRMELPFGVIENEPKINRAANLGLWAESIWLPSIYITDPRVSWEPVDEETALLVVPFEEKKEERFVVRFDPETGLPRFLEAMRYREAEDKQKTLWICDAKEWEPLSGMTIPSVATLTWFGDKRPWAEFYIEEVVYNVENTGSALQD